jgi:hypothetical protein
MNKSLHGVAFGCLVIIAVFLTLPTFGIERSPQKEEGTPASLIVCSPDRPTAFPDEVVTLRAWANLPERETLTYDWKVTGGTIDGTGPEVTWNFSGVQPGIYRATVYVTYPSGEVATYSAQVLVQERAARGKSTGWSFLPQGNREEPGYGLYSYILFGSRPAAAHRERYIKVIESYVQVIEYITSLERAGIAPHQLNVTYLPITKIPREKRPTPGWLLEHYDYARARAILSALPGDYRTDGPYIVSSLKPLSRVSRISGEYLYQDLSMVPPHIVALYAKEFFNQAAQERFWEQRRARQLALNLRTTLGNLAQGFPEVRKAMNELIGWVDIIR